MIDLLKAASHRCAGLGGKFPKNRCVVNELRQKLQHLRELEEGANRRVSPPLVCQVEGVAGGLVLGLRNIGWGNMADI